MPEFRVATNTDREVLRVVKVGGVASIALLVGYLIIASIFVSKVGKILEWFGQHEVLIRGMGIFFSALALIILVSSFFTPEYTILGYISLFPGSIFMYTMLFIEFMKKELNYHINIEHMWKYILILGPYLLITVGATWLLYYSLNNWFHRLREKREV